MSDENVVELGGYTKLDIPADRVLKNNVGEFESLVVLGHDKDGGFRMVTNKADGAVVLWLLEQARLTLMLKD